MQKTLRVHPRAIVRLGLVVSITMCIASSAAHALLFDIEFRESLSYQVQAGDTYDDLVIEHQSGAILAALQISGIEGLSSVASAGTNGDYSTLITTTFTAATTGAYTFQVGTDWGRGGAWQTTDVGTGTVIDSFVTPDDIWWGNDWNNPDVLTTTVNLQQNETYALGWVGFEGCCGGPVTFRFSVDGSPFQTLNDTNFGTFEANPAPEPSTATLLCLGLMGLAAQRDQKFRRARREG